MEDALTRQSGWSCLYSHALLPVSVYILAAGAHRVLRKCTTQQHRNYVIAGLIVPAALVSLTTVASLAMHFDHRHGSVRNPWLQWAEFGINVVTSLYLLAVLLVAVVALVRTRQVAFPRPPALYIGGVSVCLALAIPLFYLSWKHHMFYAERDVPAFMALARYSLYHVQWHYVVSFMGMLLAAFQVEVLESWIDHAAACPSPAAEAAPAPPALTADNVPAPWAAL